MPSVARTEIVALIFFPFLSPAVVLLWLVVYSHLYKILCWGISFTLIHLFICYANRYRPPPPPPTQLDQQLTVYKVALWGWESKAAARNHDENDDADSQSTAQTDSDWIRSWGDGGAPATALLWIEWVCCCVLARVEYIIHINPSSRRKIPFFCCQHIFRVIYFSILFAAKLCQIMDYKQRRELSWQDKGALNGIGRGRKTLIRT